MRGVSQVNDEFEVGYNAGFEQHWFRAMQVGRVAMTLFVLAALAGLMGRGPFSHHTVRSLGGTMSADLEPVARYATATQVTIHVQPRAGETSVQLAISGPLIEPLGLKQILPQPWPQRAAGAGLLLTVEVPPGEKEALVRLQEQPSVIGPVSFDIRVVGGGNLHLTQFIMA